MKKESEKFAVNKKERENASDECSSMSSIYHVTHLENAYSSFHEGRLFSRLVHDKSKLPKHRISGCWLSPNDWTGAGGFRYGNVGFVFDIESITKERAFYWIGSVPYGITAVRILISEKDYEGIFSPYDPSKDLCPWWYDTETNKHYYNNKYCLELFVEDDMNVASCSGIEIVDHSGTYCSLHRNNPAACKDIGLSKMEGGRLFLS